MDSHDPKRLVTGWSHQNWRAFRPVMHLHENHYTKRAGVAGIRARARPMRYLNNISRGNKLGSRFLHM
ncbi:hypothetical protein FML40_27025 [Klebsiella variicola]|nr:hypothetical protein [Klebsiella variicola]